MHSDINMLYVLVAVLIALGIERAISQGRK